MSIGTMIAYLFASKRREAREEQRRDTQQLARMLDDVVADYNAAAMRGTAEKAGEGG